VPTIANAYRRVAPPLTPGARAPLPADCKGIKNLGSVTDIGALADLPHLQQLLLHKVRGIATLTPLANATELRYLYLADLREVTELFDMTKLTDLTELTISLPNLTDLRPVLSAPN
jgi:hypothetical protein